MTQSAAPSKMIARTPDGVYLAADHPDWAQHAEPISGEYRRVRLWNADARDGGLHHEAVDYVPVEHVEAYVQAAMSNVGRNVEAGDRAWDHVEIGTEHDAGPGGDNQHAVTDAQAAAVAAIRKG